MNIGRREAITKAGLTIIGYRLAYATATIGVASSMAGCNLYNDILNWVPVGEAAVNSILNVLAANGVILAPAAQSLVALVEAGFTALTAAVKEYQSVTPPPVGAVAKIQEAFTAITDNFSTFLKSLSVSSSLVAIIIGLGNILFSTIAAFANRLPAVSSTKLMAIVHTVSVGNQSQVVVAKERTRRGFKKDWNSQLTTGSKQGVVVPKASYLPVSFFEHL